MKYKCIDCGAIYDEEIQECRDCGGKVRKVNDRNKKSMFVVLAVFVFAIALISLMTCSKKDTTVANVTYDKVESRLVVELEGDKVSDGKRSNYRITLLRNGNVFGSPISRSKVSKVIDAEGTYEVEIRWVNSREDAPELRWNGVRSFVVEGIPVAPLFLSVDVVSKDFKTQSYVVSISMDTSVVPQLETEFSSDGKQYQSSPVFKGLKPGSYTFYARNTRDNSLVNTYRKEMYPIKRDVISDAEINKLLNRIASGDYKAYDAFIAQVEAGQRIKVTGLKNVSNSSELIDYIDATRNQVSVSTKRNADNEIVAIIVR